MGAAKKRRADYRKGRRKPTVSSKTRGEEACLDKPISVVGGAPAVAGGLGQRARRALMGEGKIEVSGRDCLGRRGLLLSRHLKDTFGRGKMCRVAG